jgi:hypothetical protein
LSSTPPPLHKQSLLCRLADVSLSLSLSLSLSHVPPRKYLKFTTKKTSPHSLSGVYINNVLTQHMHMLQKLNLSKDYLVVDLAAEEEAEAEAEAQVRGKCIGIGKGGGNDLESGGIVYLY